MAKIKDLADVLVSNALMLFPVDDERYELAAAVSLMVDQRLGYLSGYRHSNERVNDWLHGTDDILYRGSRLAFGSTVLCSSYVEADLAFRVKRLLSTCRSRKDWRGWNSRRAYLTLWRVVLFRLGQTVRPNVGRPAAGRKST
jgi:hypothetical protein